MSYLRTTKRTCHCHPHKTHKGINEWRRGEIIKINIYESTGSYRYRKMTQLLENIKNNIQHLLGRRRCDRLTFSFSLGYRHSFQLYSFALPWQTRTPPPAGDKRHFYFSIINNICNQNEGGGIFLFFSTWIRSVEFVKASCSLRVAKLFSYRTTQNVS